MSDPAACNVSTEGYLILATGAPKYLEMARNLAASIRLMDPSRQICLVHDEDARFGADDQAFFDRCVMLPGREHFHGVMNKLRVFDISPFQRTMFIDADCLMIKHDIGAYWQLCRGKPFAIPGKRRVAGEWKGADISALLKQEGAPYLIQMNSGVFCFERSASGIAFTDGLLDYYLRRREHLAIGLHRGVRQQTDEIYLGLWMGLNGLDPVVARNGHNSWSNSTWRAFLVRADPEKQISSLRKPVRSTFGIPNPLLGWDRISPTIMHFIALKPAVPYRRAAAFVRAALAEAGRQAA